MNTLLQQLNNLLSSDQINKVAQSLGENEGGVSKALSGILPTILQGLMQSPSSSHGVLSEILGQASNQQTHVEDLLGGLASSGASTSMNIGTNLLKSLFGDKVNGLTNLVSNFAGTQASSSSSLLGIGGSLLATFLGKKMSSDGLNFSGMLNWLGGHKADIQQLIPASFSSFLGQSEHKSTQASASVNGVDSEQGNGMKWVLPIILLGLLGVGLYYWNKASSGESVAQHIVVDDTTKIVGEGESNSANASVIDTASLSNVDDSKGSLDEAGNWVAAKGEAIKIKLVNGLEIDANKGSLEDKLYSFINEPNAKVDKELWFNFDNLLFDSGKASLKASSAKQLANAVEILKAYPAVKVKLGGYTDNVGDSLKNIKLSDTRVKNVYNEMIAKGLTAASFDEKPYEGYGPQFPIKDNSTKEGQAQNRRISLSVRAK